MVCAELIVPLVVWDVHHRSVDVDPGSVSVIVHEEPLSNQYPVGVVVKVSPTGEPKRFAVNVGAE